VARFNKMLRTITETSQIIMITHHKKTMESADALFGVTMEQPGISKVVSVRIAELKS
jgi:chromosome segregation protein